MTHQSFLKCYDVEDMSESAVAHRRFVVLALDLLAVLAAYFLAFWIRFEYSIPAGHFKTMLHTAPLAVVAYSLCGFYFGVNRGLRHYASFGDVVNIIKAVATANVVQGAVALFVTQGQFPRSILLLAPMLTLLMICGLHASVRYVKSYIRERGLDGSAVRTAVVVGAGDLGDLVFRHLRTHDSVNYRILAFIDEDKSKWGLRLHGVTVAGGIQALKEIVVKKKVDEIVIAADDRRGRVVGTVVAALDGLTHRPDVRIVPSLHEMLTSSVRADPRKVQPADLLNRREVRLDTARIAASLNGKVVLVTGAGGTIGGELSRQISQYKPKKIVLLENHATALFYRDAELKGRIEGVEVVSLLGDVRDQTLLDRVFTAHKPQVVFHAAAHKHVHQLETNVHEGISNNLFGTYHLACAADRHGVETFLLISTDKAVRPSCVMGATKRAAEVCVSDLARKSKTKFMAVRFGNVLGSSGSVLKIFQEQIEKGQPVTITHREATRFFMTVEEAVGLVLQSASMAKGGEVFVLKMGEPVSILEMARNLILLSGLEPEKDVEIRVTGLKPGEKLAEELVEDPAGEEQSEHSEVMVLRAENRAVEALSEKLFAIELAARNADSASLVRSLGTLVPTFTAHDIHTSPAPKAPEVA